MDAVGIRRTRNAALAFAIAYTLQVSCGAPMTQSAVRVDARSVQVCEALYAPFSSQETCAVFQARTYGGLGLWASNKHEREYPLLITTQLDYLFGRAHTLRLEYASDGSLVGLNEDGHLLCDDAESCMPLQPEASGLREQLLERTSIPSTLEHFIEKEDAI